MTVEDRDGVLFVDGVAAEEEPPAASPKRKKKTVKEPPTKEEEPAAPPALSGSLESVPVADLLLLLVESQRSGSFTIQSEDNTAKFFIGAGGILGCRHPTPGVNIGTFLLNGGIIDQQQLDATLVAMTEAAAPGSADATAAAPSTAPKLLLPTLIETGALSPVAAPTAVAQYVDTTLAQVLTWTSGTFSFEPNLSVVSDADRLDPQAAFVATPFAPSDHLKGAARLMGRPAIAPKPQPEPKLQAQTEAVAAASGASKKWAWLAVPAILLGLGIGGIAAYGYEQDRAECATTLANAQAELAKPPDCPATECPPPPPCEAPATSETDEEGVDEAAERPRKGKRKLKKGRGKRKKGKGKEDDGTPDISHLLEEEP